MRLAAVLLVTALVAFSSCNSDEGGARQAPSPQTPPADDPGNPDDPQDPGTPVNPLEGNWSIQTATCDGRIVPIFPGMIELTFAGTRVSAETHLGQGCEYLPEADVAFPNATTVVASNSTLHCMPAGCDSGCGQNDPGSQAITYSRTGNILILETSEDGFIPGMCEAGEVTKLRFRHVLKSL